MRGVVQPWEDVCRCEYCRSMLAYGLIGWTTFKFLNLGKRAERRRREENGWVLSMETWGTSGHWLFRTAIPRRLKFDRSFSLPLRLFLLALGLCCLRSIGLVLFLEVEVRFGLVLLTAGNRFFFVLTLLPVRKFGLVFCLQFPHRK